MTRSPIVYLPILQRSPFLCFWLTPLSCTWSLSGWLFRKQLIIVILVTSSSHSWFQQLSEFLPLSSFSLLKAWTNAWFFCSQRTITERPVCIPSTLTWFLNLSLSLTMTCYCLARFLQSTSKASSPALPSSSRQSSIYSPMPGAEFPKAAKMSTPQRPRLGTGFSEGEDILFFDRSPPPTPKLDSSAEAKKVTACWTLYYRRDVMRNVVCGIRGAWHTSLVLMLAKFLIVGSDWTSQHTRNLQFWKDVSTKVYVILHVVSSSASVCNMRLQLCPASHWPALCSDPWNLCPPFDRLPLLLLEVRTWEPDW